MFRNAQQSVIPFEVLFVVYIMTSHSLHAFQKKQLRQQCLVKQKEAARHRVEAKQLSDPANFATSAKLQRRAVALEAECVKLEEEKVHNSPPSVESSSSHCRNIGAEPGVSTTFSNLQVAATSNVVYKWLAAVISVLFVALWWRRAAAEVDAAVIWPLGPWLRQPHGKYFASLGPEVGIITGLPWISLCRRSSLVLLRGMVRLGLRMGTDFTFVIGFPEWGTFVSRGWPKIDN
jgi:hypothetical protein